MVRNKLIAGQNALFDQPVPEKYNHLNLLIFNIVR